MKKLWEALTTIGLVIIGILLAAASTVWYFIPKWKREEAEDLDRRVEKMKTAISASHEKRDVETKAAVAEVEKKAETLKTADSVDVANQFIIDEMNK